MKALFIRWIVGAIALYVTAVIAGWLGLGIELNGVVSALLAIAVLAIVNALIRPLVVLLTLPLNCLTLGIFSFVVNALMFWIVGSGIIGGFKVNGFLAALFGSIIMGILSGLANHFITPRRSN
jgi:putative membrane protein